MSTSTTTISTALLTALGITADQLKIAPDGEPRPQPRLLPCQTYTPRGWLQRHGYDARQAANFDVLTYWMHKRRDGEMNQGLCLIGNPGVGKSLGLDLATRYMGSVRRLDAMEIGSRYAENQDKALSIGRGSWGSGWHMDLVIDDLGDEPEVGFLNGVKRNYMSDLIRLRHHLWSDPAMWGDRGPCLTHFTTNHSLKALTERYGAATLSRLREMCRVEFLTGPDRRLDP